MQGQRNRGVRRAFVIEQSINYTLFKDNLLSQFYFPGLFSLLHIHTWWGQSKYVRKFEISRANFEKTQNLFILKIFLRILCINMQNRSNSNEIRHKSFRNLQKILKLAQELLHYFTFSHFGYRAPNRTTVCFYKKFWL